MSTVAPPVAPAPANAPAPPVAPAPAPVANAEAPQKGKRGVHNKPAYPLPKHADGSDKRLDFFPNKEHSFQCDDLQIPIWSHDKYRVIAKGAFSCESIPLDEQARRLEIKAANLRKVAEEIRKNPQQSTQIRKVQQHYKQFQELMATLEASGKDMSQMKKDLIEKFGG